MIKETMMEDKAQAHPKTNAPQQRNSAQPSQAPATQAQNAATAAAQNSQNSTALVSLYVGDLHPDVTESQLYEKFTSIGPVMTIRVCRDMISQRSLGYAYVNFQNPKDAERALDVLNFDTVMGKPIRIMWSQRDPSLRRSGVGNIFIKNLDKAIDNKSIYDTFSAFGNILSCKVATDEEGRSKGYGFVHFETEEAARRAIDKVNNMLLAGRKVYVGKFIPRHERDKQLQIQKKTFTNCYVKNFSPDMSDEELKDMFAQYGEISSVHVSRDDNGMSKCFGFVNFEDADSAEAACKELHDLEKSGKKLYVTRAQKKGERREELRKEFEQMREKLQKERQNTNLYIKNIDDQIDEERLRMEFNKFGSITSSRIMKDADGRHAGFGFVSFAKQDDANLAVEEMNGRILVRKPLYVAIAQRKEDRMQMLQNQMVTRIAPAFPRGIPTGAPYPQQFYSAPSPAFQAMMMPHQAAIANALPRFNIQPAGRFHPSQAPWNQRNVRQPAQFVSAAQPGQMGQYGPRGGSRGPRGQMRPMTNMQQGARMTGGQQHIPASQQMVRANAGPQQPTVPRQPTAQPAPPTQQAQPASVKQQYSAVAAQPAQPAAPQPATASARSIRQQQQTQPTRPPQVRPVENGEGEKTESNDQIDPSKLASMDKAKQKQVLGEKLYPLVDHLCKDQLQVGKITGMLLESMATDELLMLLDTSGHEELNHKVEEARLLLEKNTRQMMEGGTVVEPRAGGDN